VLNTTRQISGSFGVAIMGAIIGASVRTAFAANRPQSTAFVHGFHRTIEVSALLGLAGAVVAASTLKHAPPHRSSGGGPHGAAVSASSTQLGSAHAHRG